MALVSLKSLLSIAACFIVTNVFLVSAEDGPIIFPQGAKSLFIGHSLFVPIAEQFDYFATKSGKFPNHNAQFFQSHGPTGLPSALWDNHKPEIEKMLSSGDIELFGMTVSYVDEESLDAYKKWIDLALSYNPNTSIFIGEPWLTTPEDYEANNYVSTMQEDGDEVFQSHITTLRNSYPNNNIYFLNYGMCAGDMMVLFDEEKLIHISKLVDEDKTNLRHTLFRDRIGHPGTMLLELAAITWLSWFYTGVPLDRIVADVKTDEILGWNTQNVVDIFRVASEANEDYRLYDNSIMTSLEHNEFNPLPAKKLGLRGTAMA